MDRKNKVDSVIDEVIESKRLRQGFRFLFRTTLGIVLFVTVALIVAVAAGIIR